MCSSIHNTIPWQIFLIMIGLIHIMVKKSTTTLYVNRRERDDLLLITCRRKTMDVHSNTSNCVSSSILKESSNDHKSNKVYRNPSHVTFQGTTLFKDHYLQRKMRKEVKILSGSFKSFMKPKLKAVKACPTLQLKLITANIIDLPLCLDLNTSISMQLRNLQETNQKFIRHVTHIFVKFC